MNTTVSKFNDALLYTNKNIDKALRSVINESSNAVYVGSYDDKVVLADHTSGAVYTADYNFNGQKFVFENFEPVIFEDEASGFREAVMNYFDNDDPNAVFDLQESYEAEAEGAIAEFRDTIVEAMSSKNTNNLPNYDELVGINEELDELKATELFENYSARLAEHPTTKINYIDFTSDKPVAVSLVEEDEGAFIYKNAYVKATDLKKDKEFKAALVEAAGEYLDGDSFALTNVVEAYESILALNEAELKELVGLSLIGNKELFENKSNIIAGINSIIEEDEYLASRKVLMEEDEAAAEDGEASTDAPAATDADLETLSNALDKALEKVSDEKIKDKIEALKKAIDDSKDSGTTDVQAVKESVELLSM